VTLPTALVTMVVGGVLVASLGMHQPEDGRTAVVAPSGSPAAPSLAPAPDTRPFRSAPASPPPATAGTRTSEAAVTPPDDRLPSPSTGMPLGPTTTPIAGVRDPAGLPRFPGSEIVGHEEGVDGSVSWTLIEYATASATQDDVREHYRTVFRGAGWFVGDVDFADGVWTFAASQDLREAQLEIAVDDEGSVRVSAYVSEIEPEPTPTQRARAPRQRDRDDRRERNRPRVDRQRPAPSRDRHTPRYRGDDDDDDDDDGDDD
jgi:hypothetical protein